MSSGRKIPNKETNSKYNGKVGIGCEEMDTDIKEPGASNSSSFINQSLDQEQEQIELQLQRSLEASKQMLYGVFGNVITMLEEFERRELQQFKIQHTIPHSEIFIPDQRHKTFVDIKSNVECQLLIFETQTKACPPEVLAALREELKNRTLGWSAVRAEMGLKEIHQTDLYIAQLYEILAKGGTFHQPFNSDNVTEQTMKDGFQAMIYGEHDRAHLDKEFKENPDKGATGPKTRRSEMIKEGADRMSRARGDKFLDKSLKEDVMKYESYGPENLK